MKIRQIIEAQTDDIYKLSRKNIHQMKNLRTMSFAFKIRKAICVMLADRLEALGGGRYF